MTKNIVNFFGYEKCTTEKILATFVGVSPGNAGHIRYESHRIKVKVTGLKRSTTGEHATDASVSGQIRCHAVSLSIEWLD